MEKCYRVRNLRGKKVKKIRNIKENEFVESHDLRELSCGALQLNQKNILRRLKNIFMTDIISENALIFSKNLLIQILGLFLICVIGLSYLC